MTLFKKFQVVKEEEVIYDTYQEGGYTRKKTLKVPVGTIIKGEKLIKGGKELVSFNAKELGVDEEVQILAANCKRKYPIGLIVTIVIIVAGGVFYFTRKK